MEKAFLIAALLLVVGSPTRLQANELDLVQPSAEWQPLLAELSQQNPVRSHFAESRHNPFHKRPRRFSGTVVYHPDHGLRLAYQDPVELVLWMRPEGIWIQRSDDPAQPLSAGSEEAMDLIRHLIGWDSEWLSGNFSATGELQEASWQMVLEPNDPELARRLLRIRLRGSGLLLEEITLMFNGGRRVEISLSDQEVPWEPAPGELATYFPPADETP